jgi:hypothetical protein
MNLCCSSTSVSNIYSYIAHDLINTRSVSIDKTTTFFNLLLRLAISGGLFTFVATLYLLFGSVLRVVVMDFCPP